MTWEAAARLLAAGASTAEACAAGGLEWADSRRLLERWADSWVELVDGLAGKRVLVIDDLPGRALPRLAGSSGRLGIACPDPGQRAFREALVAGSGAWVAPLDELLRQPASWDVILLGPFAVTGWPAPAQAHLLLARLEAALSENGRMVVVVDNQASVLRVMDRLGRTGAGLAALPRLSSLDASMARVGLRRRQVFGLLRSSIAPVVAFDLEAPRATAAVLEATAARQGRGLRLALTRTVGALAGRGRPSLLVPAWLVVASRTGDDWVEAPDRPTGMIGLMHATEPAKIVRGEPPTTLDKWYAGSAAARAEADALRLMEDHGISFVPRLIEVLGPRRSRISWLEGQPINVDRLGPAQVPAMVEAAARLLGTIHASTTAGGLPVVHGDFTLSNCLEIDGRVSSIVDWSGSRRGETRQDLDQLVRHAAHHVGRRHAAALAEAAQRGYLAGRSTGSEGKDAP